MNILLQRSDTNRPSWYKKFIAVMVMMTMSNDNNNHDDETSKNVSDDYDMSHRLWYFRPGLTQIDLYRPVPVLK